MIQTHFARCTKAEQGRTGQGRARPYRAGRFSFCWENNASCSYEQVLAMLREREREREITML